MFLYIGIGQATFCEAPLLPFPISLLLLKLSYHYASTA
jgi:hypothetical protein